MLNRIKESLRDFFDNKVTAAGDRAVHGKAPAMITGMKYQKGALCCASSDIKRWICSTQKKYRQKSGSRKWIARLHGSATSTAVTIETAKIMNRSFHRRSQTMKGAMATRGIAKARNPLVRNARPQQIPISARRPYFLSGLFSIWAKKNWA